MGMQGTQALRLVCAGVGLLVSACSAPEPGVLLTRWEVSADFSAAEHAAGTRAGEQWSAASRGRALVVFGPGGGRIERGVIAGRKAELVNGVITIDADELVDDCVGKVEHAAAHELGHALGILEHGGDVMLAGAASCEPVVTDADAELLPWTSDAMP